MLPDLRGKTASFTGHRPDKLGGYGEIATARLLRMASMVVFAMRPARVISEMALGWDQAIARSAISMGVPVVAAVPFAGQESAWPAASQDAYVDILRKCSEVVTVCEGGYAPWKMQVRNQWMVEHGDHLIALWDGSPGGTANCVNYANSRSKDLTNVWPLWLPVSQLPL